MAAFVAGRQLSQCCPERILAQPRSPSSLGLFTHWYFANSYCMLLGGTANKGASATDSAVTGLKALGVRELTYKLCFMACSTSVRRRCVALANPLRRPALPFHAVRTCTSRPMTSCVTADP